MRGGKRAGAGRPRGRKTRRADAIAECSQARQLLGDHPAEGDAIARMRHSVAVLAAGGISPIHIAKVLKIGLTDLQSRFGSELVNGTSLLRAHNLLRIDAAAESGSVAAMRQIESGLNPDVEGKKAAAAKGAASAAVGTDWEDLAAPDLLTNPGRPN